MIKRGATKTGNGVVVKYVATRGTMEMQGQGKHQGKPGINTLMYFVCTNDTAIRIGVWMMPDPSPELPVDKLALEGTVADEDAITRFLQPLTPCGK